MSMSCGGQSSSFAVGHQRGGLRQPGRIPEAGDLAPRLVARAGAAVEAVEAGRGEEQRLHSVHDICSSNPDAPFDLAFFARDLGQQLIPLRGVAAAAAAAAAAVAPVVLEGRFRARQAGIDRGLGFGEMAFADGEPVEGLDLAAGVVRLGPGAQSCIGCSSSCRRAGSWCRARRWDRSRSGPCNSRSAGRARRRSPRRICSSPPGPAFPGSARNGRRSSGSRALSSL